MHGSYCALSHSFSTFQVVGLEGLQEWRDDAGVNGVHSSSPSGDEDESKPPIEAPFANLGGPDQGKDDERIVQKIAATSGDTTSFSPKPRGTVQMSR